MEVWVFEGQVVWKSEQVNRETSGVALTGREVKGCPKKASGGWAVP